MEDDFAHPGLWNGVPMFIACILQPIGDCIIVIIQGKKKKKNKRLLYYPGNSCL